MTINERIKEVRRKLQMSQRIFAKLIYVSNGYLSEIETGHKEVNDRLIHLLSTTFSVNKNWLQTGEGEIFYITPEEKLERIVAAFSKLLPEFQDFVLKQIDDLIELQNVTHEKNL